jgi:predicted  nucleic acid-binding Zn-ribbon protein
MSPPAASPSPEPAPWSSAVGHASTGKSGRVIERLQGDIDRLNRDLQLLKARLDDSEKARETLTTHNSYFRDRNSNYEQSQEANLQQLQRKDRMIEELRENLLREKLRVAAAEQTAKEAAASEELWRVEASQMRSLVGQKDMEYATLGMCRKTEQERYQGSMSQMADSIQTLQRDRVEEQRRYARLEVVGEQQKQNIKRLEEVGSKMNANFQAYRAMIDETIAGWREQLGSNDENVAAKLEEMAQVTGRMRWVMAVERDVNSATSSTAKSTTT